MLSFKKYKLLPAIFWSLFIFIVCFLPSNSLPKNNWLDKIYFDKIVHATFYFILFYLIIFGIQAKQTLTKSYLISAVLCILQGISIELIQGSSLIVGRSFDSWDIVANCVGVLLAFLVKEKIVPFLK